jgi:hypothetical protein
MAPREAWARLRVVGPDGAEIRTCIVDGYGAPDLRAVDEVARLVLFATRLGGTVVVETACEELTELLRLAGLRVEMCR